MISFLERFVACQGPCRHIRHKCSFTYVCVRIANGLRRCASVRCSGDMASEEWVIVSARQCNMNICLFKLLGLPSICVLCNMVWASVWGCASFSISSQVWDMHKECGLFECIPQVLFLEECVVVCCRGITRIDVY